MMALLMRRDDPENLGDVVGAEDGVRDRHAIEIRRKITAQRRLGSCER